MSWMKGKVFAYVFFGLAIILLALGSLDVIPMETAIMIAAFIGFPGGVVALRAYINSLGYKSYIVAGLMAIVALLMIFKVISYDLGLKLYGFVTSLTGVTLTQATTKALATKQ